MKIQTRILNAINNIKLYSYFEPHIYNRGLSIYSKNGVSNVKVLSDTLITANVTGGQKYDLEIELIDGYGLAFKCNCLYQENCKHSASLIEYIKNNLRSLEFDYQKIENSKDLYSYTLAFINTFKNMVSTFYGMNDKVLYSKLIKLIISNTLELLKEEETEKNFDLFFTSISLFEPLNNLDEEVKEYVNLLLAQLSNYNNNPSSVYLAAFKKFVIKNPINKTYNLVISNIKVNNKNEARGLTLFIKNLIELIQTNNFYYDSFSLLQKLKDVYTDKFLAVIIDILEEFSLNDLLYEFFKEYRDNNETVQNKYLDYLLNLDNNDELNYYLESSNLFSYGLIIKKTSELIDNLIDNDTYITDVTKIFKNNLNLDNFIIISKIAPLDAFNKLKTSLLNYANSTNKDLYYEMEIFQDKENAYQLLKASGILEFDKYVDSFISTKEDELVLYYQEELTKLLTKHRFFGNKLKDIMNAIDNLNKMKNGKYYIFSIYRTLKSNYKVYETSSVLDEIYNYLNTLKL